MRRLAGRKKWRTAVLLLLCCSAGSLKWLDCGRRSCEAALWATMRSFARGTKDVLLEKLKREMCEAHFCSRNAYGAERERFESGGMAGDEGQSPQIALTFDDGPHPVYTRQLLDGLKERGVTATFFVLGENIEGNEAVLKRMQEEGHLIGNHTYSHLKLDCMDLQCAAEEIQKTSRLVEAITGKGTEYFRPPFGIWKEELEYAVTMLPVLWTIDTLDWTTKNVSVTAGKVLAQAEDQGIILFHDCYASSVEAALQAADALLERGFEFVTVDRILLAP